MCDRQQPASVRDALLMLQGALGYLTSCDAPGLGTAAQAEVLAGLEQAEAQHTAARAKILAAFTANRGYQADGQFGPVAWLRGQTRVTKAAAAGAAGWARRLTAHPAVGDALAAGQLTASWAKELCAWTDQLPEDRRADADRILLAAAAGGADLADLGALAQEMIDRARTSPDQDADRDFTDRHLRLATTLSGAGRVDGDLTPGCAAALQLVLDALAGKQGPEDVRTLPQRRHDALEEACRRLIASGMLPGRDGQPLRLNVHVDLADLRRLQGASELERSWSAARAAVTPGTCYLTSPDAEAAACDATVVPIVTGRIDWGALDQLTGLLLDLLANGDGEPDDGPGGGQDASPADGGPDDGPGDSQHDASPGGGGQDASPGGSQQDASPGPGGGHQDASPGRGEAGLGSDQEIECWEPSDDPGLTCCPIGGGPIAAPGSRRVSPALQAKVRDTFLQLATGLLSGPGGLAGVLRVNLLDRPYTGLSQPLDLGTPTPEIPPHLRKAVIIRDKHCSFPGCHQPPSVCEVHHLIPRSKGGLTCLSNLKLVCRFHHLIAIHRWGWTVTCHPDGTTTAHGPNGQTLHSHGPPGQVA